LSGIIGFVTTGRTETLADGREFDDGELLLDEDAHKRIRLGYQCGRCQEVFVSAWPAHCRLCGFDLSIQREYYERQYTGSRVLRTTLTADELADGEAKLHELLKERSR
jgi:hypothetical protein